MNKKNWNWYLFQKPTDLRLVLEKVSPETLLAPYALWRYEQSGEGQRYLLLSIKGSSLPIISKNIQEIAIQSKFPQHDPKFGSKDFLETPSHSDLPASSMRISFIALEEDIPSLYSGTAFPIRQGQHLIAALGLEEVPPHTQFEWVLFHIPSEQTEQLLNQYLMLEHHNFRCSPPQGGMTWVLLHRPELYLILKWKAEKNVQVFQTFPEAPMIATPWRYKCPLLNRLNIPKEDTLLVFDLEGDTKWLDISNWWMPEEILSLPQNLRSDTLVPSPTPPKVEISLRLSKEEIEGREIELWMLKTQNPHEFLENLFLNLPPLHRQSVQIWWGYSPNRDEQYIFLKDKRPDTSLPLLSREEGEPFFIQIPELPLFVHLDYTLKPRLSNELWKKELNSSEKYMILAIPKDEDKYETEPIFVQIPKHGWRSLEELVEYKIASQTKILREFSSKNLFEILFAPKNIDTSPQVEQIPGYTPPISLPNVEAVSESERYPQKEKPQQPQNQSERSQPQSPQEPTVEIEEVVHPSNKLVKNNQLKKLERTIARKNLRGISISPQEWTSLARLYLREFRSTKDFYWLQEALSSLDQVFYLDRHFQKAVEIEAEIFSEILQLDGKPFDLQMRKLEEFISGNSPFTARLAFRYRARLFFSAELDQSQINLLRQQFYRDLSRLEPILQIREHFIYVGGIAQFLGDNELYERSRWRYRQRLQNSKHLIQELPQVLRIASQLSN